MKRGWPSSNTCRLPYPLMKAESDPNSQEQPYQEMLIKLAVIFHSCLALKNTKTNQVAAKDYDTYMTLEVKPDTSTNHNIGLASCYGNSSQQASTINHYKP